MKGLWRKKSLEKRADSRETSFDDVEEESEEELDERLNKLSFFTTKKLPKRRISKIKTRNRGKSFFFGFLGFSAEEKTNGVSGDEDGASAGAEAGG